MAYKPYRVLTLTWAPLTREDTQKVLHAIGRIANEEVLVPLYPDQAVTTASSSGTTIHCPTDYRRFEAGHKVVIGVKQGAGFSSHEVVTITSVNAGSLTVSALTGTYAAGSLARAGG